MPSRLVLAFFNFTIPAACAALGYSFIMSKLSYGLELQRKIGGYKIGSASLYTKSGILINVKDCESLLCGDCDLLLRDPQQLLVCGTRICRTCLEERLKQQ